MEQRSSFEAADYKFSIGTVISKSFSFLFKNFGVFIGLMFVSLLVGLLFRFIIPSSPAKNSITQMIDFLLSMIIQGAIAYSVFQLYKNRKVYFGDSLSHGLSRFVPIVIASLLSMLLTFLPVVLASILFALGAANQSPFIMLVGGIILVLFILIFMCMWYLVVPACTVEGLGPIESIKRSAQLTKGYRVNIFFLIVFMIVLLWAVLTIGGALSIPLLGIIGRSLGIYALIILKSIFSLLLSLIPFAFGGIAASVTYFELRSAKEGVHIDNLSNVFD